MTSTVFIVAYVIVLAVLALYGFHRTQLVYLFYKHHDRAPEPAGRFADLPRVTVQLPLYNELYVAPRLIEAAARIRYPADRLEIQVLDDSTDETREMCAAKVAELRARGVDIHYLRRPDRTGYKAGALAHGTALATGQLLLVFDADFVPPEDILERIVHHFTDPRVGMVQVRWGHLNRDYSMLTEAQAMMLDGHFVIEHTARNRSGRFFNFNGTAGVWRREAILDAGGWQHDTLTEDLDLSYRAQLRGWRFVYLPDVVAPAEVPAAMNSFKSQQYRWAKGSIQTAVKLLPRIFAAPLPWRVKAEAFFHLTNNLAYPLLLLLAIMLLPSLTYRDGHGWREVLMVDLPLFFGTTVSVATFYLAAQRQIDPRGWTQALARIPLVLVIGIGICVNQTRAVLEALAGLQSEFVRTPKHGLTARGQRWTARRYRASLTFVPFVEVALALYLAVTLVAAALHGHYLSLPFLALFLAGFGYVGAQSLREARAARA